MKCYKCNAEIRCTDKFCKKCGTEQNVQKNLIESAIENDQEAYTELYRQAQHKVMLTVYSILNPDGGNNADADDVIQESMIKGFRSLSQLSNPDSYIAWMQKIARNKSIDYLRKNKNLNFSDLSTDEYDFEDTLIDPDESKRPDLVMDQNAKVSLLREILSGIPQEQRLVLVMYYYHNMKITEIASELGCTEATVKSRLKYGKSKVETGVNKIEKKYGIKLYSIAPVLLLYWLFKDCETAYACESAMPIKEIEECNNYSETRSTTKKASANTKTANIKNGTNMAVKGLGAKIAVAVAVGAVVIGGVTYGIHKGAVSDTNNVTIETSSPDEQVDSIPVEESSQSEQEASKVSIEILEAYRDAVKGKEQYIYKFIYLDDDDIPELYAGGNGASIPSYMYYLNSDGIIESVRIDYDQFCYAERTGLIDNNWQKMEAESHTVYMLNNGVLEELGNMYASCTNPPLSFEDENFKENADYVWNSESVSREEAEKNLSSVFPYMEECIQYDPYQDTYSSFEEACLEQLGIDMSQATVSENTDNEETITVEEYRAILTLMVKNAHLELQEGDVFTLTYVTKKDAIYRTVELDAFNDGYQEFEVVVGGDVDTLYVVDLQYHGTNKAILDSYFGCQPRCSTSTSRDSYFTLCIGEESVSDYSRSHADAAFIPD